MLTLIVADGDLLGVVEDDVRRHQHGIAEDGRRDRIALARRLVLELRHPGELAELRDGIEQPLQLGVGGNVGLYKEQATIRVDSRRQVGASQIEDLLLQQR